MKRLVADAGPLLHLHEAGGLPLLPRIGEIAVPRAVLAEVHVHAPTLWPAALPGWLKPISLSSAALAFAQENPPDWFVTDDAAARLVAESLGIETHGSLGVVLWAAAKNLAGKAEAEALLRGLEESSLWMSPRVRARAWAALASIFPQE